MRASLILLGIGLAAVAGVPLNEVSTPDRIVGGTLTSIGAHPYTTAVLSSLNLVTYIQSCGGTIINNRSILTAAHCFQSTTAAYSYRARVGSAFANSGGAVHNVQQIIFHNQYNSVTLDMDFAIMRLASNINLNSPARQASLAGVNYNLGDNQSVWAIGWGAQWYGGPLSEQLRRVQIWVVNQNTCRNRYAELGIYITDNMLCSGWLDVGGRDQCYGDDGGPLVHNGVVVGVASWRQGCAQARYPGVNGRVSRAITWIQANA